MKSLTRYGRTLLLAAVLAVGAACWLGCGDDDDSSSYYSDGGGSTGSIDSTGNHNGDSVGTLAYSNKCGKDGTADSCRKVEIGGSTWMAENLNYQPPTGNSWCYGNADSNCVKYGRLYDWNTAMAGAAGKNSVPSGVQGVCPSGWHLPSRGEWGLLAVAAGGTGPYGDEGAAGKKLKAKSGWNNNGDGTNDYGFSALPGGNVNRSGGFVSVGNIGSWWSASSVSNSYVRYVSYSRDYISENTYDKAYGFSVRCVENKDVIQYKVTVSNAAGADVIGDGDYIAGATVNIFAGTVPAGRKFKNWVSPGVTFANANYNNTTFTMPANAVTVTAVYETAYKVTVSSAGSGASEGDSCLAGETVSIKAGTAPAGQQFKNWTSSNSSVIFADANSATTTFIMPASAVTVTANFELVKYAVTVSSAWADATGSGSYTAGTTVSIYAGTAPTNYEFKDWTSASNGVTFANANRATTTFTMPANAVTVTANFSMVFIVDTRDSKIYKVVTIGNKSWMAENLNYQPTSVISWCYSNSTGNCTTYGRLYNWNTANTVCPSGWHLPTRREWGDLAIAAGGSGDYGAGGAAGKELKSKDGWYQSGNGTNYFGFSALPGGYRSPDGKFNDAEKSGYWWTATEGGDYDAYRRGISYNSGSVVYEYNVNKGNGYSVRCVAD